MFTQDDFQVASNFLLQVVQDDMERARALDPVVRWTTGTWRALSDAMSEAGFSNRNPAHLTALQCQIAINGRRNRLLEGAEGVATTG